MKLTKTTENYAKARNLAVTVEDLGNYCFVAVWEADNDCEWLFSYRMEDNGSFSWRGNVYLDQAIKEELPATLADEAALRRVLDYVAKELKAG